MSLYVVCALLLLTPIRAFYLPGLAPVNYCIASDDTSKSCKTEIPLYVNRLNTEESVIPFEYHHFDFCTSDESQSPVENLGQVVFGERIRPSPYKLEFLKNVECKPVCTKTYRGSDTDSIKRLNLLKMGMALSYQHHWILDNMPVTWCYLVNEGGKTYCSTGFPMGCQVRKDMKKKKTLTSTRQMSKGGPYRIRCVFGIALAAENSCGDCLILTPYIKNGSASLARQLSEVNSSYFLDYRSHSGFITVKKEYNSNLFFWFFPAATDISETPLIIWLQGGPGFSSMKGLFDIVGPIKVENGKVASRNVSWADHSLLFLDNPVGAGFSFMDDEDGYPDNEDDVSHYEYGMVK